MKDLKHTPGPWFHGHTKNEDGMYSTKIYNHVGVIATLHWLPVKIDEVTTGTTRDENAKLIAAAPDLLDSLNGMVEYFNWLIKDPNFNEYKKAIEAIKKATS